MELFLLLFIAFTVVFYRNYEGKDVGKFFTSQVGTIYEKYAPFSFKVVREKTKQLGKEFTVRQYTIQVLLFSSVTAIITYMYFYNVIISIVYVVIFE